jgi:hypothetical protein
MQELVARVVLARHKLFAIGIQMSPPEGLRYELLENGKLSRFIFSGGEVVTEVDANCVFRIIRTAVPETSGH